MSNRNAPNYWLGFILNILLPGVGHFTIGHPGWAITWLVIAFVSAGFTGGLGLPVIIIGCLLHYRMLYKGRHS